MRKSVGRRLVVAALAALLPLAFGTPAQAAFNDTLDQHMDQVFNWSFQAVPDMAQTFKAGMTGNVDRVSLPVWTPGGFAMWTVSIDAVDANGVPTATRSGGSAVLSGSASCCQPHDFAFTTVAPVTSGTKYAIVVHVSAGSLRWLDSNTVQNYTDGDQYTISSASSWSLTTHTDFGFEEWVAAAKVNHPPTVTVDRSAITSSEGSSANATNGGSCGDPDGDAVSLTATAGAVSSCTSGRWSWSLATPDELAQQTITITASDGTLTASASFTVAVTPVNPTAQILGSPATITVLQNTTLQFAGTASSPDAADNTAGFTLAWTVTANGAASATSAMIATGSGSAFSFTPKDAGTDVVTLTATDDGLMSATASVTVVVQTIQQALDSIAGSVQELSGLNAGQKNSLIVKLHNAAAAVTRGDNNAASNELQAFLNELQADVDSGKLTPAQAAPLQIAVNAVRASLATSDSAVVWWPLAA